MGKSGAVRVPIRNILIWGDTTACGWGKVAVWGF